jgi:CubicO group peptidase (beta-lactamase class C family)
MLGETFESEIDILVKERDFCGSILISHKGNILIKKSYGMANIELEVPNTSSTIFRLGSVTKIFTATAIMQLSEKSINNLDYPISHYIPNYPNGEKFTIFHLLTHTSGIPNLTLFPDFMEWVMKYSAITDTIERFKHKPLEFQPGERYNYSNSGYILLSYIIELLTGMLYENYIKENIFAPINMRDSGFDKNEIIIKNRASGYNIQGDNLINATYINMSNPYGAASLYSTVEDLYLFDQALYTEVLLMRTTLEKMFRPYKDEYGLGWIVQNNFDQRVVSHGGGIHGFSGNFLRYIDTKTCFIILSNVFYPKSKIENLSKELVNATFKSIL